MHSSIVWWLWASYVPLVDLGMSKLFSKALLLLLNNNVLVEHLRNVHNVIFVCIIFLPYRNNVKGGGFYSITLKNLPTLNQVFVGFNSVLPPNDVVMCCGC